MHVRAHLVRILALIVAMGAVAIGGTSVPAQALVPVTASGTVTDAATTNPVEGAVVDVYDDLTFFDTTTTGPGGGYTFDLEPGSYFLDVSAPGYSFQSLTFEVTPSTTSLPEVALQPIGDPVSLTGSVLDSETDAPLTGASVEAYGPDATDIATTDGSGNYQMDLVPGTYELFAVADGYDSGFTEFEVTESSTTIPPIRLDSLAPGITAFVTNATFGGPASGVTVTMEPVGGGATVQRTTDADGTVKFSNVATGSYVFKTLAAPTVIPGEPVQLDYVAGSVADVSLSVTTDLACEPASANAGLANMGFENNLDGWTLGYQTESITSITADSFTAPWEGTRMARLGESKPTNGENQNPGPNIMCQDFTVTDAEETFAFNVFTYDYTGFDEFMFDVVVTNPASGETLAAYQQGAWGEGTELKTSGWRGVKVDLSGHVGETVRLTFRAGGTSDSLYAFWAYLDSAVTMPPPVVTSTTAVTTTTGSVMTDPITGQVTVAMPNGSPSDVTLTLPAECQDPALTPDSVSLILDGIPFAGTASSPGVYTMTIPAAQVQSGPLNLQISCPGETTKVVPLGQIVLYDPSGIVSDGVTGTPVVGAEVRLFKVPGWTAQSGPAPYPATSCQTNETKPTGSDWNQPAPTDLGQEVSAASPEISPNVNPFVTNSIGYYGWDVATGCWYVQVSAPGYKTLTSPVVGVPSAVTDLDLQLLPKQITNSALPTISGTATVGSTLTATQGTWNIPGVTPSYQWLRNGTPIPGATASTYELAAADVLAPVGVRVTASKDGHDSASADSTTVTAPKMKPKVTLKLPKKAEAGSLVTAVVVVKVADGKATGKVVVKAGKKKLGAGSLKAGKAKVKLKKMKAFKPGKYQLQAKYSGSANTSPGKSKKVAIKLTK